MDSLIAIDRLDDAVHNAPTVSLTDQVRFRPEELRALAADVRTALRPDPDIDAVLDRLDAVVAGAKKVWLTDQVRVDKEELYDVLDSLRALMRSGPESRAR